MSWEGGRWCVAFEFRLAERSLRLSVDLHSTAREAWVQGSNFAINHEASTPPRKGIDDKFARTIVRILDARLGGRLQAAP